MDFTRVFATALRYPLHLTVFVPTFVALLAMNLIVEKYFTSLLTGMVLSSAARGAFDWTGLALVFAEYVVVLIAVYTFIEALFIPNAAQFFASRKRAALSLGTVRRYPGLLINQFIAFVLMILPFIPLILMVVTNPLSLRSSAFLIMLAGALAALVLIAFFLSLNVPSYILGKTGVLGAMRDSARTVYRNKLNTYMAWSVMAAFVLLVFLPVFLLSFYYAFTSPLASLKYGDIITVISTVPSTYIVLFGYAVFANFYLSAKKR